MPAIAPDLAVVLVHYRSPGMAARSLAALQADAAGAGLAAEWVIVDNGSAGPERRELASLPARLLEPGENLGYAVGAGLGVAATTAPSLVLVNPDVTVLPGCLAAFRVQMDSGDGVELATFKGAR